MNQLIWRLHRNQAYFAAGMLAVLSLLLLITGINMANDYHVFLRTCAATQSCSDPQRLFSGDGAIIDIVDLTLVVPLLFGLFWGAPLVANELEVGTHNFVWTQGVTRRRWLSSNVMWALLAAVVWGAAMAAIVSWWRTPENAIGVRFNTFDIQGIVPVAYAVFAVTLGIAVGSVLRRTLPAVATTLGVFVAVRVVIAIYVRPHFQKPVSGFFPLSADGPPGAWAISSAPEGPAGQPFNLNDAPAACRVAFEGHVKYSGTCLSAHGYRQLVTYQPASRFWEFQGIEAAIFVLLSGVLITVAYRFVLRRDA